MIWTFRLEIYRAFSNGKINFRRSPPFPTSSLRTFLNDLPRWRLPLFWTHLPLCLYYPPQGRAFLLIVAIIRSLYAYIGYEKGRLWSRMSWWTSWQWLKLEQMFDMQLKEKKESIFSSTTLYDFINLYLISLCIKDILNVKPFMN